MAITKHFDDFQEDQFDFHGYCIRKVWKGRVWMNRGDDAGWRVGGP